jgi:hypothetical protein
MLQACPLTQCCMNCGNHNSITLYHRAASTRGPVARLQVSKLGALECLSHLHKQMGRYLASAAVESMAICSRLGSSKSSCSVQVRLAALSLAAAVVEGLSPYDRSAPAVHAEAWKLFEKGHKVRCACDLATAGVDRLHQCPAVHSVNA